MRLRRALEVLLPKPSAPAPKGKKKKKKRRKKKRKKAMMKRAPLETHLFCHGARWVPMLDELVITKALKQRKEFALLAL